MKHLVEKNVLHYELRNTGTVHAAIQDDLVRPGIVAPELSSPTPGAPANLRTAQIAREIFTVEAVKERNKIMVAALRRSMGEAHSAAPHTADAAAGPV